MNSSQFLISRSDAELFIVAVVIVGIPFNWLLGGTRTAVQRIAIAFLSVPATVVLAVTLFSFNALLPDAYAALLRFADCV